MNVEKLKESGRLLPSAARAVAISSYTSCLDRFPIVKDVNFDEWDFNVTIAGIYVALTQLNQEEFSEMEKDLIIDEVTTSALELYPDAIDACNDCREFVDRTYIGLEKSEAYKDKREFIFSDSLGSRIVWNLFGRAPDNIDERELVRPLGGLLVHSFISWWK